MYDKLEPSTHSYVHITTSYGNDTE